MGGGWLSLLLYSFIRHLDAPGDSNSNAPVADKNGAQEVTADSPGLQVPFFFSPPGSRMYQELGMCPPPENIAPDCRAVRSLDFVGMARQFSERHPVVNGIGDPKVSRQPHKDHQKNLEGADAAASSREARRRCTSAFSLGLLAEHITQVDWVSEVSPLAFVCNLHVTNL